MSSTLNQLLALQTHDLQMEQAATKLRHIPEEIARIRRGIEQGRGELEQLRKTTMQLQLSQKERELDLQAREGQIQKHSAELNNVKSNETYRALSGEIDKAKAEQSVLEDGLLALFDQIDRQQALLKVQEQQWKVQEAEHSNAIQQWQAEEAKLTEELQRLQESRLTRTQGLAPAALSQYERIHVGVRGPSIVVIKGEICSGCHMRLPPHLINEVQRDQGLVFCNICSRIVYLPSSSGVPSQPMAPDGAPAS